MWVLSGVSGLSCNFELYVGKDSCVMQNGEPHLAAAGGDDVRLCQYIPLVGLCPMTISLPAYFCRHI